MRGSSVFAFSSGNSRHRSCWRRKLSRLRYCDRLDSCHQRLMSIQVQTKNNVLGLLDSSFSFFRCLLQYFRSQPIMFKTGHIKSEPICSFSLLIIPCTVREEVVLTITKEINRLSHQHYNIFRFFAFQHVPRSNEIAPKQRTHPLITTMVFVTRQKNLPNSITSIMVIL